MHSTNSSTHFKMDAPFCPICLSDIEGVSNIVTTECGHSFHCSCLMQHALVNGFSCPCCRYTMAQRTPAANPIAPDLFYGWISGFGHEEDFNALVRANGIAIAQMRADRDDIRLAVPAAVSESVRDRRATIGGNAVLMSDGNREVG